MIAAGVMLAAGMLLTALAVLLRKKLGRSWLISLLAGGILVAVCGGLFTWQQWTQAQQRRESIYLSLRYLERYEQDSSFYYLKRAGSADSCESAAARCLLELVRGNDLSARLNLDAARSMARGEDRTAFLNMLQNLDAGDPEQLAAAVNRLVSFLKLSDGQKTRLDSYLQAESNGYAYGYGPDDTQLDENTAGRLQVGALLKSRAYDQAVSAAALLADREPSAGNRLLLAEAVAEAAYYDMALPSAAFAPAGQEGPWEDPTVEQERRELLEQKAELESKLLELNIAAGGGEDETSEKRMSLTEEIQALQIRADKLYVYRAFSAIADLRSVQAELVRARLYFALQEYDRAVDALRSPAGSLRTRLFAGQELSNALDIVDRAYREDAPFHSSQEFQDAVVYLLSAPFPDLMYLSQTDLTRDFAQRVVSDQKTYGQSLFATGLDTSQFPTVRVTLAGREELLEKIAEHDDTQARDTRQEVTYTALVQELSLSNICVVVDRSGSMGGAPMDNLKAALENFIRNMTPQTMVSLVAFDNSAEQLAGLTQDQALLLNQAAALAGSGGTEITAGIRAGIEALEPAAGGRVMLLMTDGQSSVDFSCVEQAAAAGITIHTIGFGSVNDALLEEIAERTGGQYVKADSSAELSNVYASLQRVIGHVLTLEYTAPDPDSLCQRYFFLKVDGFSVRLDYFLGREAKTDPRLYACSPAVLTPDELERADQRNNALTLRFTGEGLLGAASAEVGGLSAQITDQQEDTLVLSVPPGLTQGWQTVELTLTDGSRCSFDRLLLVGETVRFPSLRLGSLTIQRNQGVLPGNGTLVLADSGIRLTENVSQDESSLSLSVSGILILPAPPGTEAALEAASYYDVVDLGSRGDITGWGVVYLDHRDGAYASGAPERVARGGLTIQCGPGQSNLIQNGEGGD